MGNNQFEHAISNFIMPTANTDQGASSNDMFAKAVPSISREGEAAKANSYQRFPSPVDFPRHLFIPEGAESLDIRAVYNVPSPTTDFLILRFVAPEGCVTRFIKYGIYNDGDVAANYDFKPFINKNRIFRYHGQPMADNVYHMALGLGPDLSESSMIPCQLTLNPGDILEWFITNTSGVDTSMGVRMMGYFDTQQIRVTPKFG